MYLPFTKLKKNQVTDVFWQFFAGKKINLIFIGAQWTNAGLDPQISKFNGQGWTEKYEGWEMVQNASKIKSREISGKVPGQKKNQDNKKSRDQKKTKKKIIINTVPSWVPKVRTFELFGALFDLFFLKLVFSLSFGGQQP